MVYLLKNTKSQMTTLSMNIVLSCRFAIRRHIRPYTAILPASVVPVYCLVSLVCDWIR